MRRAFSLLEVFMAVALVGATTIFTVSLINTKYLTKETIKLELTSHLNLITAIILECKEYSGLMPIQDDGSLASTTLLSSLECNTTTSYPLDGGKGSFVPSPIGSFTPYTATQTGSEFYFETTTLLNSNQYEALDELSVNYSLNQFELSDDGTTANLKFYLSR